MASFVDRMVGAAKLDVHTYEEVEGDAGATNQAMAVVVLAAIAAGIGTTREGGLVGMILGAAGSLVGWYIWALVTYFVGTRLLPGANTQATPQELLRTTGFSASPGVLRVLQLVPGLGTLLAFVASVWMLVAMVVAVRQALDYTSTGRAVAVCLIGFACYLAVWFLVALVLGVLMGAGGAVAS
jgi:hypothetical protein